MFQSIPPMENPCKCKKNVAQRAPEREKVSWTLSKGRDGADVLGSRLARRGRACRTLRRQP